MPEIPESRLAEIEALCAEIAERIRTQDNAGTAHPYFVVYEGDPNKSPDRWRFVSPFLTRDSAKAFILQQRHNLRRPFVFVESAHANHEIRAAREVFAALPELAREVRRLRAVAVAAGLHRAASRAFTERLANLNEWDSEVYNRARAEAVDATRGPRRRPANRGDRRWDVRPAITGPIRAAADRLRRAWWADGWTRDLPLTPWKDEDWPVRRAWLAVARLHLKELRRAEKRAGRKGR